MNKINNQTLALAGLLQSAALVELIPRIMIKGEQIHLSNHRTASHIRALLLSGIRCVSLWKSQGGKTWHLLFNRRKILMAIDALEKPVY